MVTEPFDPHLVERRPVPLQVPHDDADPHHVSELGIRRRQDGDQVVEDEVGLGRCILLGPEKPANESRSWLGRRT